MNDVYIDSMVRIPKSNLTFDQQEALKEMYTIKTDREIMFTWFEDDEVLSLPWEAAKHFSNGVEDRRILGEPMMEFSERNWEPREGQENAVNTGVSLLSIPGHKNGGGNIIGPCGSGKTFVGSEIALRLGVKTVVLVHKQFLANQWEKAFKTLAPEIRIGRVKQKKCDYEDKDVVIVMCQSLVGERKYPAGLFNSPGLIIGDEIHRYGAHKWQGALPKFAAAKRLGFTATFRRNDGMLGVITNHIGGVIGSIDVETLPVRVHQVMVGTRVDPRIYTMKYKGSWGSKMNKAKLVTALVENNSRNRAICRTIVKAYDAGRKVFVLSERRKHLEKMADLCHQYTVPIADMGFYIGGKSDEFLDEQAGKQIIFGTYKMASEGLDIPAIDTLFVATPVADIEQSVGRIVRPMANKKEPVVVDYVDHNVGPCAGLAQSRLKQYELLKYNIA